MRLWLPHSARTGGIGYVTGQKLAIEYRCGQKHGELRIEDRHSVTDRRMTTEKCLAPCAPDSRQSNKFVEWPGPYSHRQFWANSAMAASRVADPRDAQRRASKATAHQPVIRPATTPSASTSISSSFHMPDVREAKERLRMR